MNNSDELIETIRNLKCSVCNHILSVAPVMIISDNEYLCGRCKGIDHVKETTRNVIYERVSKHLLFPCVHPYCEQLIRWEDVETHEKNCSFKTVTCPVFHEDCEDVVKLSDLPQHMVNKHGNNVHFENVEFAVPMFKSFVVVASVKTVILLIYISKDKLLVTSAKSYTEPLSYNVKLQNGDKCTPTIFYENEPIEQFDERKHCFRCLDRRCDLKYHPYSTFNLSSGKASALTFPSSLGSTIPTTSLPNSCIQLKDIPIVSPSLNYPNSHNDIYTPPAPTIPTTCCSEFKSSAFGDFFTFTPHSKPITYSSLFPSLPIPTTSTSSSIFSPLPISTTSTSSSIFSPLPIPTTSTSSSIFSSSTSIPTTASRTSSRSKSSTTVTHTTSKVSTTMENTNNENVHTQSRDIKCTSFDLSHLYNIIGVASTIKFSITINFEDEQNQQIFPNDSCIPRSLLSTIDNSDILRKSLECPICTEYMLDSIYQCERGHHICSKCKVLDACPTCKGVIATSRNFALENIAECVSLSCSSKESGCEFRGNLKAIFKHEKNCVTDYDKDYK